MINTNVVRSLQVARGRGLHRLIGTGLCAIAVLVGIPSETRSQPAGRIGVSGVAFDLSLKQAVMMALERNPEIAVSRARMDAQRMSLFGKQGVFDPQLSAGWTLLSDTMPVGSILAGGARGLLSTDSTDAFLAINQRLPFGGLWSARFTSQRSTTSNVFTQLNPQFPSRFSVGLEFPLWRNLGVDARRLDIQIASKSLQRSQAETRRLVLDVVTAVRNSYWDLVMARQEVEVRTEAVDLADQQLSRNRRLVEAGELSQIEIVAAEAELQGRREELLGALEQVTRSENALKRLILGDRTDDVWSREIRPGDREEQGDQEIELREGWRIAVQNRPELEAIQRLSESQELTSAYLENQSKPSVDLVASYSTNGLAGAERTEENPFSSQNATLLERVNALSAIQGLQPLPASGPAHLPPNVVGGLGQSLSHLLAQDFRTAQFGIRVGLPLFNRTAQGELGVSRAREKELQAERADLEQAIEAEIRNALQAVATSRQRLVAARAAREAGRAQLDSAIRLFEAGESTNFMVLTRQNDYVVQRSRELQAHIARNKAVAQLQRVLGNTLPIFGIRLDPF